MDGIHQRAGRHLKEQRRSGADAEREADIGLAPALLGEIDSEERSERRLQGADEKIEAVQSALGAQRCHGPTITSPRAPKSKGRADALPGLYLILRLLRCQPVTARRRGFCGMHSSS